MRHRVKSSCEARVHLEGNSSAHPTDAGRHHRALLYARMLHRDDGRRAHEHAFYYEAAEGYVKTGLTVALDGSEDHKIVREASVIFEERGMRRKINLAIEHVRREYNAGRLPWSKNMRRV